MDLVSIIIWWLVTAVSLMIIAQLNVGIHVASFERALIASLVIGLINAFIKPVVSFLALPITILTLGLFAFVINALMFALAAFIVQGFSLRHKLWSPLIGSLLLTVINILLFWLLGQFGIG